MLSILHNVEPSIWKRNYSFSLKLNCHLLANLIMDNASQFLASHPLWSTLTSSQFCCLFCFKIMWIILSNLILIVAQATIGIHSDIASAQSCQLLCVQTEDCVAFSWHFGSEQFDENTCQLFSGLLSRYKISYQKEYILSVSEIGEETSSCADCVSGPKSCTCSSDVACSVDAEYLVHLELEVRLCLKPYYQCTMSRLYNVKINMAK